MTEQTGEASLKVRVREARVDDVPAIVAALADDTVGGHGNSTDAGALPGYIAAFERIDASVNDTLYVAEVDGLVVGTFQTTLTTAMSGHGRSNMTISAVHVQNSMRGRGVGEAMMRFAIGKADEANVNLVQLSSNKARLDAHRFYERLGFKQTHLAFKMKL